MQLRFPQNFLAESASNIGAWVLQGRCLVLYQVAQAVVLPDPDGDAVLRLLVEQVPEAHKLQILNIAWHAFPRKTKAKPYSNTFHSLIACRSSHS